MARGIRFVSHFYARCASQKHTDMRLFFDLQVQCQSKRGRPCQCLGWTKSASASHCQSPESARAALSSKRAPGRGRRLAGPRINHHPT